MSSRLFWLIRKFGFSLLELEALCVCGWASRGLIVWVDDSTYWRRWVGKRCWFWARCWLGTRKRPSRASAANWFAASTRPSHLSAATRSAGRSCRWGCRRSGCAGHASGSTIPEAQKQIMLTTKQKKSCQVNNSILLVIFINICRFVRNQEYFSPQKLNCRSKAKKYVYNVGLRWWNAVLSKTKN